MKKLFCIVLCMVLLSVGTAFSEEFSIRNGLKWGNSPETVLKLENISAFDSDILSNYDETVVRQKLKSAMVSGHQVEALFGFKDGQLVSIEYSIPRLYIGEIISALEAKYGKAYGLRSVQNTQYYECASNMYKAYLGAFTTPVLMVGLSYWWILDNETIIVASDDRFYGNDAYVAYIDPSPFAPVYDFSGI